MGPIARSLCLAICLPTVAAAQGSLRGVVVDSLYGERPLAGATVMVEGLATTDVTDRYGRFRLDGVPEGPQLVTFFHPSYDSLGLGAPVTTVEVRRRGATRVRLASPSWRTISAVLCRQRPDSTVAVVLGRARAAEDDRPLPGAIARVEWFELALLGGPTEQELRRAEATADADGRFVLCGVPNNVSLTMDLRYAGQVSGAVQLAIAGRRLASQDAWVSVSDTAARYRAFAADAADEVASALATTGDSLNSSLDSSLPPEAPPGLGRLRVQVRDVRGRPVADALVALTGSGRAARTDSSGVARLQRLPAGSQTVVIRKLGLAAATQTVLLRPEAEARSEVELLTTSAVMAPMRVIGLSSNAIRDGFEQRRRQGFGWYFDERDIEKTVWVHTLLQRVPGIRLQWGAVVGEPTIRMRQVGAYGMGSCQPHFVVDGGRMFGLEPQDMNFFIRSAVRMEIYPFALQVPAEFSAPGFACGAIVIWTR